MIRRRSCWLLGEMMFLSLLAVSTKLIIWWCLCLSDGTEVIAAWIVVPGWLGRYSHRQKPSLSSWEQHLSKSINVLEDDDDDDDDDKYNENYNQQQSTQQQAFETLLQSALSFSSKGESEDDDLRDLKQWKDPLQGYTIQQLEDYVTNRQKNNSITMDPSSENNADKNKLDLSLGANEDDDNDEVLDEDDTMYLDPEFYVQSQEHVAEDGSILLSDDKTLDTILKERNRHVFMQNYLEAVTSTPNTALETEQSIINDNRLPKNPTEDDLWNMIRERGTKPPFHATNGPTAEELHRKVFENEQGYLQSSQAFQKALIDPDMAKAAAAERRGKRFRKRQQQVIQQLEQAIQAFEVNQLNATEQHNLTTSKTNVPLDHSNTSNHVCAKCHCVLSNYEKSVAAQRQQNREKISKRIALCMVCRMELLLSKSKQETIRQERNMVRQNSFQGTKYSFSRPSQPFSTAPTSYRSKRSPPSRTTWYRNTSDRADSLVAPSDNTRMRRNIQKPPNVYRPTDQIEPPREMDGPPKSNDSSTVKSPWVRVIDPDTKEIFYWNEETEEMRWQLEN